MNKAIVDHLISNMKKADLVKKASPWMVEGFGEKQMNVRYLGINLSKEWEEIFSFKNNLLMKFIIDKHTSALEYYLANRPPFFKITSTRFSENDKWETLLGELRNTLRKEKMSYVNHTENFSNLYVQLLPYLQK